MRSAFLCLMVCLGLTAASGMVLGQPAKPEPAAVSAALTADREAILQSARDFSAAFEKGDAKAVASFWTAGGEYESDDGTVLRGRANIEAAFAAHFKGRPAAKMEVTVESIRFLSPNAAIEEGLTRTSASDMLPASGRYRVLHVRDEGKWKIATSREWATTENRLADLDWLLGSWQGQTKDHVTHITFAREPNSPFIIGEFAATVGGKTVPTGTMKIGLDPLSGQFKSWHFDPAGGHSEGVWLREGKHWLVDSHGVQADGAPLAVVNVLSRAAGDELGWRSIERRVAGQPRPDSLPVQLKRVAPEPLRASGNVKRE